MKLPRLNLHLKIAIALATISIAVVGALGITLYMASVEMEDALVEQLVAEELDSLYQRARSGAPISAGGPNLQYYVLRGPEDYRKLPLTLQDLGPGHHEIGNGRDELHVAVRDVDGARYVVVYDSGQHEVLETRFRNLLLLALATAAAIAVLLGYWLAGVLMRQLTHLASQVRVLAPDVPHPPLERADHDPEVAAVAHALDEYHARIVNMIRREQEFTANASHELRTPLTGIRTSCELVLADRHLSEKTRARVEMIDGSARQMTERIEALLFLARPQSPQELELVALRRCAEEAADPYRDEITRKGLSFQVEISEAEVVRADRKALQLVLANLIKNAVHYTVHGDVRVTYDGRRMTVSDSGSGIAPEHLPQLFERYFRAVNQPDGRGLGLAIVHRICDDLGWKIEVQSEIGAGSAFSVVLT